MTPSPSIAPMFACVGCFSDHKSRGKGISVYRIDRSTGVWTLVEVFDALVNPQYLALDNTRSFLYVAHGRSTEISAYSVNRQTGILKFLNKQEGGGKNPPHLIVDPTNRYVVLANGHGISVFPINDDGSLAPASDSVVPPGKAGPYTVKQFGAHPHQVLFDPTGRYIIAPDKGVDRVHVYRLDASDGKFVANNCPGVKSRDGAAPRHLIFHPNQRLVYVVNELDSTVTAYSWNADKGELKPYQVISTIPTTHTGNNTGAEIAVDRPGNFIYVSNRGHNSIVTFAFEPATGMLNPTSWESTQGKTPRFFTLDPSGDILYAANMDSHTIVVFGVDHESGKLTPTGQIVETGSPTCIVFLT